MPSHQRFQKVTSSSRWVVPESFNTNYCKIQHFGKREIMSYTLCKTRSSCFKSADSDPVHLSSIASFIASSSTPIVSPKNWLTIQSEGCLCDIKSPSWKVDLSFFNKKNQCQTNELEKRKGEHIH